MTAYTKSTNFATKDTLTSGDPLKIVKGTEINTEFDNIATAVNSKSNTDTPTFTGTVTIPILSVSATSTLTGVATLTAQPILSSLTASKPVFTDASKGLVSTGTLGADQGGSGVANNAAMTVTGVGNFAYTRTLTGTTTVTFPTTGTLLSTADVATQANQETATSTATFVSPARQQFHPSAAKAWLQCNNSGGIAGSYNVASIADTGTGVVTVTLTTAFSSTNYAVLGSGNGGGGGLFNAAGITSASVFTLLAFNTVTQTAQDSGIYHGVAFGDQ